MRVEDGELDDASVEALEEDGDAARPACLASPRSSSTAHSATVGARTTNTFFWITGDKLQQKIKHRLEHIVGRATAFRYLRATAFRYLRQEKQLFFCGKGLQNRVDLVELIPQTRGLEKERDIRGRA